MKIKFLLNTFIFIFLSIAATAQLDCNNWLKMPNALSGVTVGDIDITGNQVTIEAICNATGDTTRALVSKHRDPSDVNYFLCPDLAQITTTSGFFSVTSSCPFVNNKTYHAALVYDGNTLKLYRNGFLLGETPATGNLITNNWPTTIGEQAYSMFSGWANISNIFKGVINEVRIWNVARSQSELQTYLNTSLPSPATTAGLVAYYTFEDLSNKQGNPIFDGTLRGAATITETNPDCDFVVDSCANAPVMCNNWLYTPNTPSYAAVGQINVPGNIISVEAVFNRTAPYSGGILYAGDLVSKHNTPADVNYLLRPNSAEITTTNGYFRTPDICEIELNKTYHVAMVYDGSTLKFYRDGYLMSQVAATGSLIQNSWQTRIGYYEPQGFNTNFIGYINEVRIWNTVRTQAQIRANMFHSLPAPTTQAGLLAYYTFNDLINKQGNTAYNAVLGGSASINQTNTSCTFTPDSCVTPVPCNTWLNNPVNSSISAGDLDISGNQVTVEALINRTQPYLPGGANDTEGDVVSKHNTFTDVNYLLRPNHAYITTTNGFFGTPDICDLLLNKTYHVAMVYDGSTLKFYRDGLLMSQVNATGDLILNDWKTRVGWYEPEGFTTQFLGYINEVRIWNVARTQAEINAHMFTQLPDPAAQTGLRAYYTFDNLLNKQGDAAYNGVINGAAQINQTNPDCSLLIDSCSIVVPVTITSFTTRVKNNQSILVNWHTEEENNITQYAVQRSEFANSGFVTIGTVNAIKNRSSNDYAFEDKTAKPGVTYYYRLQIIDNSGAYKYSAVRSERIMPGRSVFATVYPNPASGDMILMVNNYTGDAGLTVFNNLGQPVFAKKIMISSNSGIPVDLSRQPKGSYWLQVVVSGERIIKKIIKL